MVRYKLNKKQVEVLVENQINSFDWVSKISEAPMMPRGEEEYESRETKIIRDLIKNKEIPFSMEPMSGSMYIESDGFDGNLIIYATPHWNEFGRAPVTVVLSNDEQIMESSLPEEIEIPMFNLEDEVVNFYKNKYLDLIKDALNRNNYQSYTRRL